MASNPTKKDDGILTLLSASAEIIGDIVSEGEVQVDGSVKGNIQCRKLVIGESGEVSGSLVTEECIIHGKTVGQLSAENLTLTRSANVEGEVLYESLAIETGAIIDGQCRRKQPAETVPKLVTTDVTA